VKKCPSFEGSRPNRENRGAENNRKKPLWGRTHGREVKFLYSPKKNGHVGKGAGAGQIGGGEEKKKPPHVQVDISE